MATPEIRRRILSNLERSVSPQERYFDNLSYHALRIPFVVAVIPDVRIVHIIRDPISCVPEMLHGWTAKARLLPAVNRHRSGVDIRAVPRLAWSFLLNYSKSRLHGVRSSWGPVVPNLVEFAAQHGPAAAAAFQWASMVRIARRDLAALPTERILQLRYEALIAEPENETRRLCQFVDAHDPSAMISFASTYLDPARERDDEIRREPTESEWQEIISIVSEIRNELAYDPSDQPGLAPDGSCE